VSLEVRKGENLFIIGPNGAGKSTLLELVARVQLSTKGRVWVKRLCHRVAWLEHGRLRAVGNAAEIVEQYRQAAGG
jgi:ABC-type polysaccharide/polyol phosphate transport system ATPase subunit